MQARIPSLILAAALAGGTAAAFAHGDGPGLGSGPRGEAMQAHWQEHMARRAAELKAKLQLSPEQEQAWTRYLEALKPQQPPTRPDPQELARLTTPERLDRLRALRQQREAEMERRDEATRAFYATLNADQQKAFDQHTARFWGPRRPRH
ncbi:MAG: Spy/CpxP family protein refolding chaperone [Hylemonella sp.]